MEILIQEHAVNVSPPAQTFPVSRPGSPYVRVPKCRPETI